MRKNVFFSVPHDKGYGSELRRLRGWDSGDHEMAEHAEPGLKPITEEAKSLKSGYSGSNLALLKG